MMASGRFDGEVWRVRAAVWGESKSLRNPFKPPQAPTDEEKQKNLARSFAEIGIALAAMNKNAGVK